MESNTDGGSNIDPVPSTAQEPAAAAPAPQPAVPLESLSPSVPSNPPPAPAVPPAAEPSPAGGMGAPPMAAPDPAVPLQPPLGTGEEDRNPEIENPKSPEPSTGSLWTIPLLCAGIGLIACCLLIPLADENRRLSWEQQRLQMDLDQLQRQVSVNDEFLNRLGSDSTLAERLAERQMKRIREGTSVLELKGGPSDEMSPFLLVHLPPPPKMPDYRPVGGKFAAMCRYPRTRLYLTGAGLFMVAAGLVLGASRND